MSNLETDTNHVDALIALKAFLLGRLILDQSERVTVSLEMIDVAVKALTDRNDDENQRRLVFYLLLRSEVLQGGKEAIAAREDAKLISQKLKSSAFECYLRIVDGVVKVEHDVDLGVLADDPMNHAGAMYRALGENAYSFSERDLKFIDKTNLLDILKHHDIAYPP